MLDKIYGFREYKVVDNGSWVTEYYEDEDLSYTCNILKDGSVNVFVFTKDKFPKLVTSYEYKEEV